MTIDARPADDRPMRLYCNALHGSSTRRPRRRRPNSFWRRSALRLIEDGTPLAGGALTLASPHPLIARRTWLWRADSRDVVEALGFVAGAHAGLGDRSPPGEAGRRWLASLAAGPVHEEAVGPAPDGPRLGWVGPRPFTPDEADRLREAARFAAAPLAALSARATLTAALEAYLGRRSAGARAGRSAQARRRRDDRSGASVRRPARLHSLLRKRAAVRRSLPRSTPGSTASPAPCTLSAAKCSNSWATAC